jgi:hypothetical protein
MFIGDGVGDDCVLDSDGDGVDDINDTCIYNKFISMTSTVLSQENEQSSRCVLGLCFDLASVSTIFRKSRTRYLKRTQFKKH